MGFNSTFNDADDDGRVLDEAPSSESRGNVRAGSSGWGETECERRATSLPIAHEGIQTLDTLEQEQRTGTAAS
jgi:hypothetical protein